jgi:CBS domain-containing protein
MKASDVMTCRVVSVRADAPVFEAGRLMLENQISGLPVVDGDGRLVGIVTERDFLRHAEFGADAARPRWFEVLMGPARSPLDRRVEEVMTPGVVTVPEDLPIEEVARLLRRDIKRVPVMHGNQLVGIISRVDLVRTLTNAAGTGPDAADSTRGGSSAKK